jgi:hypothetical protein
MIFDRGSITHFDKQTDANCSEGQEPPEAFVFPKLILDRNKQHGPIIEDGNLYKSHSSFLLYHSCLQDDVHTAPKLLTWLHNSNDSAISKSVSCLFSQDSTILTALVLVSAAN